MPNQNTRYLLIAIIILVLVMIWAGRGNNEAEMASPEAMPSNGMVGGAVSDNAADAGMPAMDDISAAPAMEAEGEIPAPAPASPDLMPSGDATEIDGVPAGAEVSGEPMEMDTPAAEGMPSGEESAEESVEGQQ